VQDVMREGSPSASPPLVGSTLQYLQGDWNLTRAITDRRAGRAGTFSGQAAFTPVASPRPVEGRLPVVSMAGDGRLAYREQGELTFGEHRGPAWRELILLGTPEGAADVLFADGRAFYRLDLRAGRWQAEHPCSDDWYLVTVSVTGAISFTESWQVRGPDKDYDMTATFTRTGWQA
jgi:hypothetical protein